MIELSIENTVVVYETNSLLTGIFAGLDGWRYDLKLLTDTSQNSSQYLTHIGGHSVGLKDGFSQTDWASGVVLGLDYLKTIAKKQNNSLIWTPKYSTGSYSIYHDIRRLYSDYSYMQTCNVIDELSTCALRSDCLQTSISVGIYKRLDDGLIIAETTFNYVEDFSGNERKHEFRIVEDVLSLNGNYSVKVGFGSSVADIEATCEYHKASAGSKLFLKYLNPKDITVFVVSGTSVVTLSELTSIDYTDQAAYSVDYDLGVISLTGLTAEPVVLSKLIDDVQDSLLCYYDDNFIALPEHGVVQIGDELIAYLSKGLSSLENCVRGYRGSIQAAHTSGSVASFVTQGIFAPGDYYVKYNAVPRVDYEITTHNTRTANKTNWLDVQPLTNLKFNKIIQLVSKTINLARITLDTDKMIIGGNLYGPLFFGTDVARLTATAYDASDSPVEDIEITIEKIYGPGSINNAGNQITAESNSEGEVYGFYNAPYTEAEINLQVSDVTYDGSDTLINVPHLPAGVTTSDLYIYQVMKHDPTLGTVGKKVKAVSAGIITEPWGLGYIDCRCEFTDDFDCGYLQINYDNVRYSLRIRNSFRIDVAGHELLTRFYVEEYFAFMGDPSFAESDVWLYQEAAEVWDSTLARGANVILYEYSMNYKHPRTKLTGAYGPVKPDSIAGTVLRYKNRLLPVPEPTNDNVNLGAYLIVSPAESRFRAYAKDPFTGNTIVSNEIRLKMVLPKTLTGVDSTGVLPVPYGFTFITDDFNIGAGLGGSNFITVNPAASGFNQFTLRGSI